MDSHLKYKLAEAFTQVLTILALFLFIIFFKKGLIENNLNDFEEKRIIATGICLAILYAISEGLTNYYYTKFRIELVEKYKSLGDKI
jgi:hypothetical protein